VAVLIVVFGIVAPTFASWHNASNIVQQITISGIVAAGEGLVLICGGVDLSVGAIAAFIGILLVDGQSIGTPLMAVLLVFAGAAIGAFNGMITVRTRIPSLIVTLGTMTILNGVVLVLTDGNPLQLGPQTLPNALWPPGSYFPPSILVLIVVITATYVFLRRTRLGVAFYAVGDNRSAADRAGIRSGRVVITSFALSGAAAAIGGILLTAQLDDASPTAGSDWMLTAIAAVVIGGVSLFGGKGNVRGIVMGVLLLGVIADGMNLRGISSYYQMIVEGLLILVATGLSSLRAGKLHLSRRGRKDRTQLLPGGPDAS
jgi:ribose transport system permease protein